MPDDDSMLGQNTIDVRNEARREYQRDPGPSLFDDYVPDEQTALCTNDPSCQAAADGHDPDCPVEEQLKAEFGY